MDDEKSHSTNNRQRQTTNSSNDDSSHRRVQQQSYRRYPPSPLPSTKDPSSRRPTPLPTSTPRDISRCCGLCGSAQRNYHLRIAGPSMGGKTTLIRYLLHGQAATNIPPTNEMEVSRVFWNSTSFIVWDSRKFGEDDLKPALPVTPNLSAGSDKQLIAQRQNFDALVYVIDASDPGRLKIAGRDFERLLKTYHDVPVVLILGTKKDSGSIVDPSEIRSHLKVVEIAYDRECEVFLVSSWTGEGVDDALEWLSSRVKQKEGMLASFFDFFNFRGSRATGTLSCGRFGTWDPFSMCRYSRLS